MAGIIIIAGQGVVGEKLSDKPSIQDVCERRIREIEGIVENSGLPVKNEQSIYAHLTYGHVKVPS